MCMHYIILTKVNLVFETDMSGLTWKNKFFFVIKMIDATRMPVLRHDIC